MKKASRVLLIIGKVFSIVCAVIFFIYGILMTILSFVLQDGIFSSTEFIINYGEEINIEPYIITGIYVFSGVFLIIYGVLFIITSTVINKTLYNPVKKNYINSIVFSAITGTTTGIFGGIFGLISLSKEDKSTEEKIGEMPKIDNKDDDLIF